MSFVAIGPGIIKGQYISPSTFNTLTAHAAENAEKNVVY